MHTYILVYIHLRNRRNIWSLPLMNGRENIHRSSRWIFCNFVCILSLSLSLWGNRRTENKNRVKEKTKKKHNKYENNTLWISTLDVIHIRVHICFGEYILYTTISLETNFSSSFLCFFGDLAINFMHDLCWFAYAHPPHIYYDIINIIIILQYISYVIKIFISYGMSIDVFFLPPSSLSFLSGVLIFSSKKHVLPQKLSRITRKWMNNEDDGEKTSKKMRKNENDFRCLAVVIDVLKFHKHSEKMWKETYLDAFPIE